MRKSNRNITEEILKANKRWPFTYALCYNTVLSSEISLVLGLVIAFQIVNSSANITPEFKYKYQTDALQYFTYVFILQE